MTVTETIKKFKTLKSLSSLKSKHFLSPEKDLVIDVVSLNLTPCVLEYIYQYFGETCRLFLRVVCYTPNKGQNFLHQRVCLFTKFKASHPKRS
jgi:hypothetical protein